MSCLVDQEFALDLQESLVICGFKICFLKLKTHTAIGKAWQLFGSCPSSTYFSTCAFCWHSQNIHALLLFVVLNNRGPVQGKAKPRPPLHAGLIPVKTCSTFILCFFPHDTWWVPDGYHMEIFKGGWVFRKMKRL